MIKHALIGFLSLAFVIPSHTFAIYHTNTTENKTERKEQRQELRSDITEKRNMLKTEAMEKRDILNTEAKEKREALKMEAKTFPKEQLMEKREAVRMEIKEKREDLRETIKQKRETFREEAKERVDTLKRKLSEERAKRIEVFFGTMVRKFEAAISRLRTLADRIDSRLDKIEDAGKDVSEFRVLLDNAKITIETAEDSLDKAKEEFNALAKSENPQEYFKKVKEIVSGVAQKIKDAHKALIDVINLIKGTSNVSE